MVLIHGGIQPSIPIKRLQTSDFFKRLLTVECRAKNMDPGVECEFRINTRSPPPLRFQKRPPETKQRVAQRRLGLGCMLHFLHSGQMVEFPVAGICSSSSTCIHDRTDSSIARGLFKSSDRYFPPPRLVRARRLLQTDRLHKNRITSRRRDAPRCRFRNETPSTSPTLSSLV